MARTFHRSPSFELNQKPDQFININFSSIEPATKNYSITKEENKKTDIIPNQVGESTTHQKTRAEQITSKLFSILVYLHVFLISVLIIFRTICSFVSHSSSNHLFHFIGTSSPPTPHFNRFLRHCCILMAALHPLQIFFSIATFSFTFCSGHSNSPTQVS
ncbi:hypothetical protein NE237_018060 [Protea cynaroides]|uniref:Transmembrane protein n=1 Tax=Protea cynaroides TaxID=273540 RepID=A0A9Q0K9B0_9MAGN|nr:hypothetical protein NE237_018060 [Protea cynaroides]